MKKWRDTERDAQAGKNPGGVVAGCVRVMLLVFLLAARVCGADVHPALMAQPSKTGAVPVEIASKPLFRDFMGINGHFTFKPELYRQVGGWARNYHNLNWDVKQPVNSGSRLDMRHIDFFISVFNKCLQRLVIMSHVQT